MVWSKGFRGWVTVLGISLMAWPLHAEVSTFEDVNLPPDAFWNGADGSGVLVSGAASFLNNYSTQYFSWDGFAASTRNDPRVKGWDGQYNAITGTGLLGSSTYSVCFRGFADFPKIVLDESSVVQGLYVTNNTYVYYSLSEGDSFSKKFGGDDGNEADWFKLIITGLDANDAPVGSVDFYLADFRFEDNSLDYIIDKWTFVDLSSLGEVASLVLDFSSTDNGDWGMNTPAYCVLDNLVPADAEPCTDPGVPGFDPLNSERINPIFRGWATDWVEYQPAAEVSDVFDDPSKALDEVSGNNMDVVSLGELDQAMIDMDAEPGRITLVFGDPNDPNDPRHIHNGAGDDFVVFENGFISAYDVETSGSVAGQLLAELAYVEVSTNGVDFIRFPSLSLVDHTVGPYGTLDPNRVTNLAGLHPNAYSDNLGTAFDLEALKADPMVLDGRVDLQDIRFVRLVDIPGNGAYVDSTSHPIYDQWPTVGSGGFDLEAIGVLYAQTYVADINRDGIVDTTDQELLAQHMDTNFGGNGWLDLTDLNKDWRTDAHDLAILEAQMGSLEAWRQSLRD